MPAISQDQSRRRIATAATRAIALTLLLAFIAALVAVTVALADLPTAVTLVSAAVVSLMAGVLTTLRPRAAAARSGAKHRLYAQRLDELTVALRRPSREVDRLLDELAEVAAERQAAVDQLTKQLAVLSKQEQELRRRKDELGNVSIPVVQAFAEISAEGEKRSARRDYLLFGLGVVITTVISIVFVLLQGS